MAYFGLDIAFGQCPPDDFTTVSNFNFDSFFSEPWFSRMQEPGSYVEPENSLYCVRNVYRWQDRSKIPITRPALIFTYEGLACRFITSNVGSVDGSPREVLLQAVVERPGRGIMKNGGTSEPAYSYIPNMTWVVAAGGDGGYDWAVLSRGEPTQNGSEPGTCQVEGNGLWLWTRDPQSESQLEAAKEAAENKGYDLSVLKMVDQDGCDYPSLPPMGPGCAFPLP